MRYLFRLSSVLLVIFLLGGPERAPGQGMGLPLLSDSSGQAMLAIAAGQRERVVGGWPTTSRLAYGRAALGFAGRADVYLGIGFMDLSMQVREGGLSEMTSSASLAYGLGTNLRLLNLKSLGLSLLASASAWRSQPTLSADLGTGGDTGFDRQILLHYDWREGRGAVGLGKTLGATEWYAGVGGYLIQRKEKRWSVLKTPGADFKGPVAAAEFRSGFVRQMFVGVDVRLPEGFKLSVEVERRDWSNFGVLVGVSQTGSPR